MCLVRNLTRYGEYGMLLSRPKYTFLEHHIMMTFMLTIEQE